MGLDDDPFTWTTTKDGRVLVSHGGRQVAIVAGPQAERLRPRLERSADWGSARACTCHWQLPSRQRARTPSPLDPPGSQRADDDGAIAGATSPTIDRISKITRLTP